MTRTVHAFIFLGILATALVASNLYLFARFSHYLQLTAGQRRVFALVLIVLGVLTLLSLPLTRELPREAASVLAWLVFPWMGFLLLMIVVMLATDMLWLLAKLTPIVGHDPTRRAFLQRAFGFAALGATGFLGGFSLWNGLRPVEVKPITVTLNRLPKSFDGLKIVQITDLHIGPMIDGAWLRQVVDKVNALKPDIIAVTGDLVDGSVADLSKHTAPIADLKAPLGVYFITGNHEYYSGVGPWCAHVRELGLTVLRNERVSLTRPGSSDSIDLAGVDDWHASEFGGQRADLPKALLGRDSQKALILLAHQPAQIDQAALHGVDLQLSGHTHGGQIWPFSYFVYLQQPYVKGLHRHKDTASQIYVSSGTGFWGPPMRFGTTAEITDITLRSA